MTAVIALLAISALSFFIRNLSGPFNSFGIIRNLLLRNSLLGATFYKLLECSWCLGFHCGYIVYLLWMTNFNLFEFVLWGLAGSTISAIINKFL